MANPLESLTERAVYLPIIFSHGLKMIALYGHTFYVFYLPMHFYDNNQCRTQILVNPFHIPIW